MAASLPTAGAPRPRRPPRSSGARRAQDARAQARYVQRLLGGFDALGHRGCQSTRLGAALAAALALGGPLAAEDGGVGRRPPPFTPPPLPAVVRCVSPLQAALVRMSAVSDHALPPLAVEALTMIFAAAEAAAEALPEWGTSIGLATGLFSHSAHMMEAASLAAQLAAERTVAAPAGRGSVYLAAASPVSVRRAPRRLRRPGCRGSRAPGVRAPRRL